MNLTFSEVLDFLEQYKIAPKFRIGEIFDLNNCSNRDEDDNTSTFYVEIVDILLTATQCEFVYKVKGLSVNYSQYFAESTLQQQEMFIG